MTFKPDSTFVDTVIESPNFWAGRSKPVRLIVIHDEEYPDTRQGGAVAVANMFTNPALQASAHYAVNDTVAQCVREADTAWHAPGQNADGIGIEHGGYASYTPAQWSDVTAEAELHRSARLTADIAKRHGIPARWVTDAQLADGTSKGYSTHAQGTRVLNGGSGHTDPGANFPFASYMALVNGYLNPVVAAVKVTEPTIKEGSTGAAVKVAQAAINAWCADHGWHLRLVVDGDFGPATDSAIRAFQRGAALTQDGIVGPLTWAALGHFINIAAPAAA